MIFIVFCITVSITGYLSNVSPVKKARQNNTQFFNATIQDGDTSFQRIVCFTPEKHPSFLAAQKEESNAVKIKDVELKSSNLKGFTMECKVKFESVVLPNQEVDFQRQPPPDTVSADVQISQLITLPPGTKVNLTGYINIDNRPIVDADLPYLRDPIPKREVAFNDDSGIIALSLWGDKIQSVPESGTYRLTNILFKRSANSFYLTTNLGSMITPSEIEIAKNGLLPADLVTIVVSLPPSNVHSTSLKYFCNHCKKFNKNESPNPILFVCGCGGNQMSIRLKKRVEAKLEVQTEKGEKTVYIGGQQMEKFFQMNNKNLPN